MSVFARSLAIRHLVCGSCNGCEHELNALEGPDYDVSAHGWRLAASPRQADVVTVTGPMTDAMREAAARTLQAVPEPKLVVAVGDCALGAGPFAHGEVTGNGAGVELGMTVAVPGCPPSPAEIVEALRRAADELDRR